uniref:AIG1-type G domain-containing protein n=1 Tax=Neolamprologus brichardi TaxID=32507 RepID=A0A3Q4I8V2_NEOBR
MQTFLTDEQELPELRIVLFGRTTVGKSTLGGIILGDSAAFTSSDPHGERTKTCHVERKTDSDSHSVVVVDTPGLFKMGSSEEDVVKEIKWATENVEPGPHVFLLVERLKIITSEELKALQVFERTFGKRAVAYATLVFTHKNDPRGNEADIKEDMKGNEHLRETDSMMHTNQDYEARCRNHFCDVTLCVKRFVFLQYGVFMLLYLR